MGQFFGSGKNIVYFINNKIVFLERKKVKRKSETLKKKLSDEENQNGEKTLEIGEFKAKIEEMTNISIVK